MHSIIWSNGTPIPLNRLHYSSVEEVDSFSLNDLIIDSMILQIWNKYDSIVRTNEEISSIIDVSGGSP